jgi:transcriptional regulator with GAF, ATPase, and Fis domain
MRSEASDGEHGRAAHPIEQLDVVMRRHIEHALRTAHGRVDGPFGAARVLGLNPHTLRGRMLKLGIDWRQFRIP